jgi:CheY-like chemotaxis protein
VVLLDLHMPGMSGEDLLTHLCGTYPKTPVIIVTADATNGTSERMRAKGAVGYFAKPVNLAELGETLNRITAPAETGAS